jgi:hypothetical protein
MRNAILLTILTAGLPLVMSANTLTVDITTTIPTTNDYLIYLGCTVTLSSCTPSSAGALVGIVPIGASEPASTFAPLVETIPSGIISGYVTAVGLDSASVVVGLKDTVPIKTSEWSAIFNPTNEATIQANLTAGKATDLTNLVAFFEAHLGDMVSFSAGSTPLTGDLGRWTLGTVVGTIDPTISSTPEPGTLALTGTLLAGLIFFLRKRRTV